MNDTLFEFMKKMFAKQQEPFGNDTSHTRNFKTEVTVPEPKLTIWLKVQFFLLSLLAPVYKWLSEKTPQFEAHKSQVAAYKLAIELQKKLHERMRVTGLSQYAAERQLKCTHMKGGRHVRTGYKDYNVWNHHYIDGSRDIQCMNCSRRWTPNDPEWEDAVYMTKNTTNGRTSSEMPLQEFSDGSIATPKSPNWVTDGYKVLAERAERIAKAEKADGPDSVS